MPRELILRDRGLSKSAFNMVADEDIAQRQKWGNQEHNIFEWLAFTTEELGELSEVISEFCFRDGEMNEIFEEATQVATLALKIAHMVANGDYNLTL